MRYLIVSDIHANLVAFEAVLEAAELVGGFDQIWNLGDVVGYGPRPSACLRRLIEHDQISILGNHDLAAIGGLALEEFNPDAASAVAWTCRNLTPDEKDLLESLPEQVDLGQVTLVHGSPRRPIWEYLRTADEAAASFPCFETATCLVGHTHVPALFLLSPGKSLPEVLQLPDELEIPNNGDRIIYGPGSVGQPRDRDPRAAFAILDDGSQVIRHYRTPYNVALTQQQMLEAGMPFRLIDRLSYGW